MEMHGKTVFPSSTNMLDQYMEKFSGSPDGGRNHDCILTMPHTSKKVDSINKLGEITYLYLRVPTIWQLGYVVQNFVQQC